MWCLHRCLMSITAIRPASAVVLLTAGCFLSTGPSAEDLEKHRAIWAASAITSYTYDYTLGPTFFNNLAGHPIRIQVSHGAVSGATFLDSGAAVPGAATSLPTIDGVFDNVAHLLESHSIDKLQFDARFGYPTSYHVAGPPDANGTVTVANLVPSP